MIGVHLCSSVVSFILFVAALLLRNTLPQVLAFSAKFSAAVCALRVFAVNSGSVHREDAKCAKGPRRSYRLRLCCTAEFVAFFCHEFRELTRNITTIGFLASST